MSVNNDPTSATNGLTMDLRSLDRLKSASGKNASAGVKDTAKQLEGLFMQQLIKSMRATTMSTGMLDNSGTEMGTSMLDTQLANQMSGLPGGLSDMIAKQLERQMGAISKDGKDNKDDKANPLKGLGNLPSNGSSNATSDSTSTDTSSITNANSTGTGTASTADNKHMSASERFVRQHAAAAKAAEASSGIPASNILGQAALESGWGKHEIHLKDGTPSHNLFGIKATGNWTGKTVEVATTEYVNGVAQKKMEKFRAYDSYADSFRDYASLLKNNPRYQNVVASGQDATAFAQGLQRAGYATDPNYAAKLGRIIKQSLSA